MSRPGCVRRSLSFKESISMGTKFLLCLVPQFSNVYNCSWTQELIVFSFVLFSHGPDETFLFRPSPCDEARRPQCSTCVHVFICVCINARLYLRASSGATMEVQLQPKASADPQYGHRWVRYMCFVTVCKLKGRGGGVFTSTLER